MAKGEVIITIKDNPINETYNNVTGLTGGTDLGAKFDVVKTEGVYAVTLDSASASAGAGYQAGDTITILGTDLGGISPQNNLIVTVGTVGVGGKVATFGTVGSGRVGDGVIDINIDVEGSTGIDAYRVYGDSTDFDIVFDEGDIIATSHLVSNLTFTMHDHERVQFDDKHLAFDTVDSDLGQIIALMSAAIGEDDVTPEYIGAGMYLRETLGWSIKEIAAKILTSDEYLDDAGGASNATFAKHVWKNTFGRDGTYDEIAMVVEVIEKHGYSQADVLMVAASREELLNVIDLVGMQTTGVEYVPFGG
jgi:hypothetical protein